LFSSVQFPLFNLKSYTNTVIYFIYARFENAVAGGASVTQCYDINVSLRRAAVEDRKSRSGWKLAGLEGRGRESELSWKGDEALPSV
jgi:hypothetical protein